MAQDQFKFHILFVIFATLETLFFGGIFFGWSVLVYIFKDEGFYKDLCQIQNYLEKETFNLTGQNASISNSTDIMEQACIARDDRFSLLFSIDSFLLSVFTAVQSLFNLRHGTRKTRIIMHGQFILGAILLAFTTKQTPWLIFPGLLLIGLSGLFHLITNTQFSFLFPKNGFVVVGLLNGAFTSSTGVLQIVKLGYESGISRRISFIIMIVIYLLSFVNTFYFLPKKFILRPKEYRRTVATEESDPFTVGVPNDTYKNNASPNDSSIETTNEPRLSLDQLVFSINYITHLIWYSLLYLHFLFYLNTFNLSLEQIFKKDKDKVSHFTSVFSYFQTTGFFIAPLAGFLYAKTNQKYIKCDSELRRNLMPNVFPMLTTALLSMIISILELVDSEWSLYANYFLIVTFRAFFFTVSAGYLSALYPPKYFSPLYGIMTLVAGTFALLQYAFFQWVEKAGLHQVNQAMVVITTLSLVHPLSQWCKVYRSEI